MNTFYTIAYDDDIQHHGIMGQKWGVRRFQNEDGSYTSAGKQRYGYKGTGKSKRKLRKEIRDMEFEESERLEEKYGYRNKLKKFNEKMSKYNDGLTDEQADAVYDYAREHSNISKLEKRIKEESVKNAGEKFSKKYGEELYSDIQKSRDRIAKGFGVAVAAAAITVATTAKVYSKLPKKNPNI